MNTFADFWRRMTTKTPALHDAGTKIEISSEQLQKLLRAAYGAGIKDTAAVAEQLRSTKRSSAVDDIMRMAGLA